MILFFDTNVVLDVMAYRQPFYDASAKAWAFAETQRVRGFVSAVSLTTIYYLVRRMRSRAEASQSLHTIRRIVGLAACDASVIHQAIDADLPDFEDAVQYFSALAIGADVLVTRNIDHFPTGSVMIMSPKALIASGIVR